MEQGMDLLWNLNAEVYLAGWGTQGELSGFPLAKARAMKIARETRPQLRPTTTPASTIPLQGWGK